MKILLSGVLLTLRKGEHVKADEIAGELILDTKNPAPEFTVAYLKDVAKENKIKLKSSKKDGILEELETGFENMSELAEQNAPTDTERVLVIVQEAHDAGVEDKDDTYMRICQETGLKFRPSMKAYKEARFELNLDASPKTIRDRCHAVLVELEFSDPKSHSDMENAADKVAEATGYDSARALSSVRTYCTKNAYAIPKAPLPDKKTFMQRVFDHTCNNTDGGIEGLKVFMASEGKPENVVRRYTKFLKYAEEFANAKIAASAS